MPHTRVLSRMPNHKPISMVVSRVLTMVESTPLLSPPRKT